MLGFCVACRRFAVVLDANGGGSLRRQTRTARWLTVAMVSATLVCVAPTIGRSQGGVPFVAGTAGQPSGTATVSGRVVASDTGRPIRGARITVTLLTESLETRPSGGTIANSDGSDGNGMYTVSGLPAGRYIVTASKEGMVTLSFGQTRPAQGGKPVNLADKQSLTGVNFALPRGSVITGTIVDEFGDPVIGAAVTALRVVYRGGKRLVEPATVGRDISSLALTNDLGEFRVYGLEPGTFYVGTSRLSQAGPRPRTDPIIYAPGTASLGDAQKITVGLGQTVPGANITLMTIRRASVSGVAFDADNEPFAGARVLMVPRILDVPTGGPSDATAIEPDGAFSFSNVLPGSYDITVLDGLTTDHPRAASLHVMINGQDISGIRLTPIRLSVVSGRVLLPPSVDRNAIVGPALRVATEPVDADAAPILLRPASVEADMTFSVESAPGRMAIVPQLPPGFVVKAVRHRGADVGENGIEIKPGEAVTDVEVELTNRLPQIFGTVRDATGRPAADYTVLVFHKDAARRMKPNGFAASRPDQSGRFLVTTLAPGDYLAIAQEYVDVNQAQNPEVLEALARQATALTIVEEEVKSLDLRLVP